MNIYHWYRFKSDPIAHSLYYFGLQKGRNVKIAEYKAQV